MSTDGRDGPGGQRRREHSHQGRGNPRRDQDRSRDRDQPRGRRRSPGPEPRKQGPRTPPVHDPARRAAFDTLRAITERAAYANLVLPELLRQRRVTGRDAALATELTYGTARATGLLDAVIGQCVDRPLDTVDSVALDALRLGAYQILRTRIPHHAAVASTVDLVREDAGSRVAGFVNAVLRRVSDKDEPQWLDELSPEPGSDPIAHLALRTAHPRWVARAFAEALGDKGDDLRAALEADDARPAVHLLAKPGQISADELAAITGGDVAPYSPYGVHLSSGSGDLADAQVITEGLAIVQDEGSQLVALAAAKAPLLGAPDSRWLDLCAGPGGKAVVLGCLAQVSGATLDAVEVAEHRARLVERATPELPVTVHVADGREPGLSGGYDRVLVDAPCSGLGALRRRPEARWRKQPGDVAELTRLQRELLASAYRLVRPGGVVTYVACSPHLAETEGIVVDGARRLGAELLDARELFGPVPALGSGPTVQLWPHRHGTDAMFCAVLRKPR